MKNILVIDDDPGIIKSFQLALEDADYEVHTAISGEDGINQFKNKKFDLIYLDLKMPGLDGAETLLLLRDLDKNVPIYIVTAYHKDYFDRLQSAINKNINFEIIQKPIDIDQIVLVTKAILEGPQIN